MFSFKNVFSSVFIFHLQKQLSVITRECTGFYFVLEVNSVDLEQCTSICFEFFYFDSHSWAWKYGV